MAIKKCDDTTEEVVSESLAIDTTLGPIESQTAETQTPSQVKENAALGKRLVAVESNMCDKTELSLSPVTTFGNGYVMSARPSDIVDPLRAEARKFFATDYNNQLVYVNSSLKELGDNQSTRASYGTSPITIASFTEPEIDSKSSHLVFDEEYTQTFLVSSNQFVVNGGDSPSPNLADSWKVFVNGEIDATTPTTSPQTMQTFSKIETVAGELGPYDFGNYVEYEGGMFSRKPDDKDVALEFLSDMGEDGWDRPTQAVEILEWLVSRDEKEAKRKTSEIRQELELLDRFHNTSYTKWKTREYYGEDSYVSRDIFGRIKYSKEFDDVYVPELGTKTPVRAVAYFHYPIWEDPNAYGHAYMSKENPEKAEEYIESLRIITLEVFYPRFTVDPSVDIELQTFSLISRPSPLIDTQTMFTDHYTNIVTPFDQDELELYLNNINNPAYANVKGKYNFFVPNYENYIQSGDIKEYQLENQFSNMTRDASSLQQELFNMGSDLSYVKGIQSIETRAGYDRVTEKFKNIGIPSTQVSKIKTVTDTDDLYPMINTFEMNTERSGHFMVASQQAGSIDGLLKHVMDQTIIYPSDRVSQSYFSGSVDFVLSSEKVVNNSGQTSIEVNNETRLIQTIDIFSWLEKYLNSELEVNSNFDDLAIILGDGAKSQSGTMSSTDCNESNFADTLRALILSGKIKQIVKDNFRTFEELLEGKEAYNEALVYEIVKSTSDENYLQRIFIPNTEELDLLKYIDTQIKYDKQYKYSVYVHQLIVGTKYQYTNFTGANTSNFTTEFSVSYEPSLKIARLPIFVDTTRVLDHAPVAPDVSLVPFKGHSTRLMININSSVGDYDLQPIIFTDADQTFAAKYRESRNLSDTDPIKFKSDDPVQTFEMYRTTTPPKSYDDFAESVVEVLSSVDATSVSFIDTVEPNKKYYYTFRAIDVHGNRSNPTDVYMAELVEFEGMIFFNNSVYQFQQEAHDNVDVSRSFKRYLRISPAMIHKLINYKNTFQDKMSGEELTATSAYEASDVSLGSAESPVWGKRFKMRITSKNSGKKFDINFTCKTRFINDAPDPIELQSGDQDPSKQGKK